MVYRFSEFGEFIYLNVYVNIINAELSDLCQKIYSHLDLNMLIKNLNQRKS